MENEKNEIDVSRSGKSMYHLFNHTKKQGLVMTGWHLGDINEGDIITTQQKPMLEQWEIESVLERRNHAG